ncbi:hypothetical protein HNQ09_003002 [Deinococcus budaensis]|uniref:Uncharacterized protein n=1 Tax=Deinococcus budaensis TaxID=1665626 RepID=A0A7W8GH59_9DEIO|nr:hypothetical protein [Deinococcus budaensis]
MAWARDNDEVGLRSLFAAFLVMRGSRGSKVSNYTLTSYRQGLNTFLAWSMLGGVKVQLPQPGPRFVWLVRNRLLGERAREVIFSGPCLDRFLKALLPGTAQMGGAIRPPERRPQTI